MVLSEKFPFSVAPSLNDAGNATRASLEYGGIIVILTAPGRVF